MTGRRLEIRPPGTPEKATDILVTETPEAPEGMEVMEEVQGIEDPKVTTLPRKILRMKKDSAEPETSMEQITRELLDTETRMEHQELLDHVTRMGHRTLEVLALVILDHLHRKKRSLLTGKVIVQNFISRMNVKKSLHAMSPIHEDQYVKPM